MIMTQFIKVKDENGESMYINLNIVSIIRETDSGYRLNLLGSNYIVDTADGKEMVFALLNGQS
jgi:hypothetical protein